jgi:hypothetical protein
MPGRGSTQAEVDPVKAGKTKNDTSPMTAQLSKLATANRTPIPSAPLVKPGKTKNITIPNHPESLCPPKHHRCEIFVELNAKNYISPSGAA